MPLTAEQEAKLVAVADAFATPQAVTRFFRLAKPTINRDEAAARIQAKRAAQSQASQTAETEIAALEAQRAAAEDALRQAAG